jgi:hypothetical protein
MNTLMQQLNQRLQTWQTNVANEARQWISEIIELADQDRLDVAPLRCIEQEVLDLIDAPSKIHEAIRYRLDLPAS